MAALRMHLRPSALERSHRNHRQACLCRVEPITQIEAPTLLSANRFLILTIDSLTEKHYWFFALQPAAQTSVNPPMVEA